MKQVGLFFLYADLEDDILTKLSKDAIIKGKNFIILKKNIRLYFPSINVKEYIYHRFFVASNNSILLLNDNGNMGLVLNGIFSTNCFKDMSFFNVFNNLDLTDRRKALEKINQLRRDVFSIKNKDWFLFIDEENNLLYPNINGFIKIKDEEEFKTVPLEKIYPSKLWDNILWPFVECIIFSK